MTYFLENIIAKKKKKKQCYIAFKTSQKKILHLKHTLGSPI